MYLELNNTRFFFKIVISMYRQSLIINRDDNCKEKNCNFSAIYRIL